MRVAWPFFSSAGILSYVPYRTQECSFFNGESVKYGDFIPTLEPGMATDASLPRICWMCGETIYLEECNVDELGMPVHSACYLVKLGLANPTQRELKSAAFPTEEQTQS
jgi:hypothetical protein